MIDNFSLKIDPIYNWETLKNNKYIFYFKGNLSDHKKFSVKINNTKNLSELKYLINSQPLNFSFIFKSREKLVAAVDRIRSYPILFSEKNKIISNSAHKFSDIKKNFNHLSVLEFLMSGYVQSDQTFFSEINQLQAGEFIYLNNKKMEVLKYYNYFGEEKITDKHFLIDELSRKINMTFKDIIEKSNDRPIWVPLSGGLDSRLVVAKLKEMGYSNLFTFSYGIKNNFEAKIAKKVSNTLDVPWVFIEPNLKNSLNFFNSKIRQSYEYYSNNFCSLPSYLDFEALNNIKNFKGFSDKAIIINGQTGDFISGGHLPPQLLEKNFEREKVFELIYEKNFSLWNGLKNKINKDLVIKNIKKNISKVIEKDSCSLYEYWEWKERQCKYVVNSQKIYDFYGYQWFLPFWEKNFMNFWKKVPYELKLNQDLYTSYLKKYNYKGIFNPLRDEHITWPNKKFLIQTSARVLGIIFGKKAKEEYYSRMMYYSTYQYQFAYFGRKKFLESYKEMRGVVSLMVKKFAEENNFPKILN